MAFSALILFSTALQERKNASYRLTSVALGLCRPDVCSVIDLRRGDERDTECASGARRQEKDCYRQAWVLAVGNSWLPGVWGRKEVIWEDFMQPGWPSVLFHSMASERVVLPNTASNASLCYFSRPWWVTRVLEPPILHQYSNNSHTTTEARGYLSFLFSAFNGVWHTVFNKHMLIECIDGRIGI